MRDFNSDLFIYRYNASGAEICCRTQNPLVLCYATTVHKAQGLTADFVEVHCEDMFYAGLLPVAVSRCTSVEGLRVLEFNKQCVIPPSGELLKAIKNHGSDIVDNMKCCMMPVRTISETEFSVGYVSEEDESEIGFDPAADNPRTQQQPESQPSTSSAQPHSAPNSVKIINLLNQQIVKFPVTFRHKQMNDAISHLLTVQLGGIHAMLEERLTSMYTTTVAGNIKTDKANGVIFSELLTKAMTFLTEELPQILTRDATLEAQYHPYIHQMFIDMLNNYTAKEAELLGQTTIAEKYGQTAPIEPSDAGRGTIRRVGGRTLYLMTNEITRRISHMNPKEILGEKWQRYKTMKECLFAMKASLHDVLNGLYPETIKETTRRERVGGGLTHITDGAFELFLEIEQERGQLQSIGNGLLLGADVMRNTYLCLLTNQQLKDSLYNILPARLTENTEALQQLWELLLSKYVPVCNNTYSKKLLLELNKSKTVAHRKRIEATSETSATKRAKKGAKKVW